MSGSVFMLIGKWVGFFWRGWGERDKYNMSTRRTHVQKQTNYQIITA